MQFGIIGHPRQRFAESALALNIVALLRVKLGQADINGCKAGVESAGGFIFRFSLGHFPLLQVEIA